MSAGKELSSIDFQSMIGGPLNAVIKAQAQAARTSVDFIKSVGFELDDKGKPIKPITVEFGYTKMAIPDGSTDGKAQPTDVTLEVPILTMLPIPFIRVEETTIDFNAKINAVSESNIESSSELGLSASAKGGWGPVSAELKCSYSSKKTTSATSKTDRTYSLRVYVKAVQDELPAGTEKLLGILENSIQEK